MPQINPKVAILILGFNETPEVLKTIKSVLKQDYKKSTVYYIDNASSNQSLNLVTRNFPSLNIIRQTKNIGYAGAYSKVLKVIFKEYEAAILLNPDVLVDRKWVTELVKTAYKDKKIGFVQPKIFLRGKKKHLANTFGNEIQYLGFGFCGHYELPDGPEFSFDQEITYTSGASLFIKREAYLETGGVDADFFAYLEDQDLSWRGHIMGWKSMLSADSIIWHTYVFRNPSRSSWKFYIYERNRFFFIFKNYSTKLLLLILPALIIMELGMILDALRKGYFLDKLKAYRDFIRALPRLYSKRRLVQRGRRVSDKELFSLLSPQITFSELNDPLLDLANQFFKRYYGFIKKVL